MCQSMVNIQSPTAVIRRGKKKKEEEERNRMKIYMVSLLHRATINKYWHWRANVPGKEYNVSPASGIIVPRKDEV